MRRPEGTLETRQWGDVTVTTLLQQAATEQLFQPTPSELDQPIWDALLGVPHGIGVAIDDNDPGMLVILVHDAPPSDVELVEESATRRMRNVRERFARPIDLITLSEDEASGVRLAPTARIRYLPR